ncbi:Ribonuclease Z 1 [Colletotrichum sidae]|uniref:ribonuclease Z n=1 Tax=Colletotrichum sidae TaxID=1347389 RepID=A0A4R8T9M4_9PEZI|nr:Ribonuclease Z 1 [Colletotrichum sidae]
MSSRIVRRILEASLKSEIAPIPKPQPKPKPKPKATKSIPLKKAAREPKSSVSPLHEAAKSSASTPSKKPPTVGAREPKPVAASHEAAKSSTSIATKKSPQKAPQTPKSPVSHSQKVAKSSTSAPSKQLPQEEARESKPPAASHEAAKSGTSVATKKPPRKTAKEPKSPASHSQKAAKSGTSAPSKQLPQEEAREPKPPAASHEAAKSGSSLPSKTPQPQTQYPVLRGYTSDALFPSAARQTFAGCQPAAAEEDRKRHPLCPSIVGRDSPGPTRYESIKKGNFSSTERSFLFPSFWSLVGPIHSQSPPLYVYRFGLLQGPKSKPRSPILPDDTVTAKMTSWVQVATTPTADTGPSLVLHFDHRRYLFGHLSEGTQRALNQRKYSMAKLETLFLSGPSTWRHTGGMVGMLLTLADVLEGSRKSVQEHNDARKKMGKSLLEDKGPERLEIHGGRHLTHSIATSRNFIFRKGMPIRAVELDEETRSAAHDLSKPDWEDDAIQVWKVPVVAAEQNSRKRSFGVMNTSDDNSDENSGANGGANNGETSTTSVAQKKIDKEAVAAVVEQMFSSDWTMDTLAETKLHDVRLPATIFVRRDGQISKYTGPMPGGDEDVPNIDVLVRIPWPATKVRFLPKLADPANMSVCYVVKNRGRRGKFNPKVAKQHGVQPTDFKLLTSGQTVTGADGVEVTPEMVLAPPEKPSGFAVIDIPGVSSIESFLQRYEWKDAELMNNVLVFYWLLGKSVVDDSRIQAFMKGRPEVKHVVLAPDACSNMIAFESYAILLAKLRRIDADRFPLLGFDNTTRDLSFIGPNVETAGVGMKAYLTPYLAKDQKSVAAREQALLPPPTFEEVESMPQEVLALADQARMRVKDPKFLAAVERAEKDIPNRDTEIIPLGTGSALPSKYRNVSGTLIRVPKYGNYLLDCGENTLGQLRRAFNAQEVESILRDLRCVFISHMHADHHLGLVTLLQAWDDATANIDPPPQLTIICPAMMKNFLYESKYLQRLATDRMVFPRAQWTDAIIARDLPPGDPSMLSSFSQVPVVHCHQAFAVVLTWPSGLKIAFSGDCRPSDNLVKAGMGATLLVHESTFNDDKLGDAKAKKHSTMGEALDVAYRMGARRVLLTHFSQRYAKMPVLEERKTADGADQAVLVAFDQMRVKLGEFRQAMEFLPAISRLIEIEDAKDSKQTGEDA